MVRTKLLCIDAGDAACDAGGVVHGWLLWSHDHVYAKYHRMLSLGALNAWLAWALGAALELHWLVAKRAALSL
jgi:hypothetical protein